MNEITSQTLNGVIAVNNGRAINVMMIKADIWTSTGTLCAFSSGLVGEKLIARALDSKVCERRRTELIAISEKQHTEDKRCMAGASYGLNLNQHEFKANLETSCKNTHSKSKT
jgi:hypothetical protein